MDSFHYMAVNEFPDYDNISDIIKLLKEIDVIYVQEAVNSFDNLDKYAGNELLMAANIGVYMSDIGYMWSYNEIDAAFNYNIAVLSLAEQLNMNMEYLESFVEKYSEEVENPDTILVIVEREIGEAIGQFPEEKRFKLYSAMLTGSFIEKLHLLFEMIRRCPAISNPADMVGENMLRLSWIATGQIKALDDLNKKIEDYAIPPENMLYHEELVELDSIMKSTVSLQDTSIVSTARLLEDPGFLNLCREISRLRNLVTNPGIQTIR
jgi:hypothetical protein